MLYSIKVPRCSFSIIVLFRRERKHSSGIQHDVNYSLEYGVVCYVVPTLHSTKYDHVASCYNMEKFLQCRHRWIWQIREGQSLKSSRRGTLVLGKLALCRMREILLQDRENLPYLFYIKGGGALQLQSSPPSNR